MISSVHSPIRARISYKEISTSVINPPMTWEREFYRSNPQSPQNQSLAQTQTDMFKSVTLSPIHKNSSESLKHLLELKQKRKLVEANAKLLAGRVYALSHEEQKAKSHTEEMKAKAKELATHRLEREAKRKEREANKAWYVIGKKSLDDLRTTINESRMQQMKDIQKVRDTIYEEKRKDVVEVKDQRDRNMETIHAYKQIKINQLQKQYEMVKEDEEKVPGKVKEALKKRLQPVRDKKEGLIRKEKEKTKIRLFEVDMFSSQEDVMLKRIEEAEKFNEMAKTQYTEIAELPVEELMNKYHFFLKRRNLSKSIGNADKLSFKSF